MKAETQGEQRYFADFQDAIYGAGWRSTDQRLSASFATLISSAQMESTVVNIKLLKNSATKLSQLGTAKSLD